MASGGNVGHGLVWGCQGVNAHLKCGAAAWRVGISGRNRRGDGEGMGESVYRQERLGH